MKARVVGAGLALVALASCSQERDSIRPPAPTPPPAPAAVIKDCGTYPLTRKLPDGAEACLANAVRNRELAHLDWTRPTTEGDPIRTTYVTAVDGRVLITTDTRGDRMGPQSILRESCTGVQSGLMFKTCRTLSAGSASP
jgi:hypothetical protein